MSRVDPRAGGEAGAARYRLYGLSVECSEPIPALPFSGDTEEPDVRVTLGAHPMADADGWRPVEVAGRVNEEGEPTVAVESSDDGWLRLRYADGTEFTVDPAGTRVGCTWRAPMTLEDTATYLLGPVFGIVLRRRGVTCLHASAVAVQGRALLLCGPSRSGKSTTAAAFAARGYQVLADDVAALEWDGGPRVRPAYPHLRLWPDAVRALYGPRGELPPLTPNWEKRYLDLSAGEAAFHPEPLPVAAVYLLAPREPGAAPRLEPPLPHGQGVLALVANTYSAWLPNRAAEARDLAFLGRMGRQVPVVIAAHTDAARLDELCAAIERHFNGMGEG
ncbi:MAG TPA: hypothetical protein VFJ16_31535 [Longimicrobium sp.]|nr:hypothetical protein [Longimicrobium sp.]